MYITLLKESFSFALNALRNNKLRTFLSLLGVTVGIFSIIAVLVAVDSLERKITTDLSSLDKNTLYVFRSSFSPTDVPQWKREQFPDMKYAEYEYLKSNLTDYGAIAFQIFVGRESIKYGSNTASDVMVNSVTDDYINIQGLNIEQGRFMSASESNSGTPVIILGHDVSESLFGEMNPIGQIVRIYGKRFQVIGKIKKEGAMMAVGGSNDQSVYVPANFIRNNFGENNKSMMPVVVIKPSKDADIEAFKSDVVQKIRQIRGLKVGEIDNFFLNEFSGVTNMIDSFIGILNVGGWIISAFSLLVGGFGIANIMFVSVKERTSLIGIQKSLGAKNRFILYQFLFEAVILSLFGGILGVLIVAIISFGLSMFIDFEFVMSIGNILLGTLLAMAIGLISGILPAISASRLDPVEAIRTGM